MFQRIRLRIAGWLLKPEAVQYAEAEDDPQPPKRHFEWTVPEGARVTGFNEIKGWAYNDPDLSNGEGD